jgi:hypothetical protein
MFQCCSTIQNYLWFILSTVFAYKQLLFRENILICFLMHNDALMTLFAVLVNDRILLVISKSFFKHYMTHRREEWRVGKIVEIRYVAFCSIFLPLKWAQKHDCTIMFTIFNFNVQKHLSQFSQIIHRREDWHIYIKSILR